MTALMPRLSAAAAEHRFADVATQFAQGTRLPAVILVPGHGGLPSRSAGAGPSRCSRAAALPREAVKTGTVIVFAGAGLVPFAISQMQLFAFYAMPDTKTPALMNIRSPPCGSACTRCSTSCCRRPCSRPA